MTFVREMIDSPERVAKFKSFALVSPLSGDLWNATRWFVNLERDLYFVEFGGGGPEIPFVFGLANADGVLLQAHARRESIGEFQEKNIELTWNVSTIRIPRRLASEAGMLSAQLRDALTSYGSLGNVEVTKSVRVVLPTPELV